MDDRRFRVLRAADFPPAMAKQLKALQKENARLKKVVAKVADRAETWIYEQAN